MEQPRREPFWSAFWMILKRLGGAFCSSYHSAIPPVKSSKPSVVVPPERDSYDPFSLHKRTHTHTHNDQAPYFPVLIHTPSAGSPFSSSLGERHSVWQLSEHFCFHSTTPATNVPSTQLCFLDLRTCRPQHRVLDDHVYRLQVRSYQWQNSWMLFEEKNNINTTKTKQFASLVPHSLLIPLTIMDLIFSWSKLAQFLKLIEISNVRWQNSSLAIPKLEIQFWASSPWTET